jgi:hypothetical protein
MHVALWHRYVFLRFQIEFCRVRVTSAYALDGARVGFDVDYVAETDAFFLDGFVDGGVEAEFFGAAGGFEG